MVHLEHHESTITLPMGLEEAARLSAALTEATLALSRAEYWMRVGCPKSSVEQLSDLLRLASPRRGRGEMPASRCHPVRRSRRIPGGLDLVATARPSGTLHRDEAPMHRLHSHPAVCAPSPAAGDFTIVSMTRRSPGAQEAGWEAVVRSSSTHRSSPQVER